MASSPVLSSTWPFWIRRRRMEGVVGGSRQAGSFSFRLLLSWGLRGWSQRSNAPVSHPGVGDNVPKITPSLWWTYSTATVQNGKISDYTWFLKLWQVNISNIIVLIFCSRSGNLEDTQHWVMLSVALLTVWDLFRRHFGEKVRVRKTSPTHREKSHFNKRITDPLRSF